MVFRSIRQESGLAEHRQTLDGLTATMSASNIMNLSRR
jgi:hypothetical protein